MQLVYGYIDIKLKTSHYVLPLRQLLTCPVARSVLNPSILVDIIV
jgi:hypothetical protein